MAFRWSDLFVARHMHWKPEYRKEGAAMLKDIAVLEKMAKIDVDQGVREAAARRLAELKNMESEAELGNVRGVSG